MHIAVTGANGFVGSALCLHLATAGHQVNALTRSNTQLPSELKQNPNIKHTQTDYQSSTQIKKACDSCQVLIHLIAKTHSTDRLEDINQYRATNATLSLFITQAAIEAGVKHVVFLSSVKALGEGTGEAYRNNSHPTPTTAYGISKLEAEQQLSRLCQHYSVDFTALRPPLIYSPEAKGNIQLLRRAIDKGIPLPFAGINNRRSLVDLDLLCEALLRCCTEPAAINRTLLICNLEPLSTRELVKRISTDIQSSSHLFYVPARLLKAAALILGRSDLASKLIGDLEVDPTDTWNKLNLHNSMTTRNLLKDTLNPNKNAPQIK